MSQDFKRRKNKLDENDLLGKKPTQNQIDYLTSLLEKELEIKKGTLIRTTFDFTLFTNPENNIPHELKKSNSIKFSKDSILMFVELIYDEVTNCLAAKVVNNGKVCVISFATFEEMKNINAVTEINFIDFFCCLLIKWEP